MAPPTKKKPLEHSSPTKWSFVPFPSSATRCQTKIWIHHGVVYLLKALYFRDLFFESALRAKGSSNHNS
jgi:hypothetical protein